MTRNKKDFILSDIPVYTVEEVLENITPVPQVSQPTEREQNNN